MYVAYLWSQIRVSKFLRDFQLHLIVTIIFFFNTQNCNIVIATVFNKD